MQKGRLLIILGVLILLGAVAVGFWLMRRPPEPVTTPAGDEEGTPVPEVIAGTVEVVVAVQNIPRSMLITEDIGAVALKSWPEELVPPEAIVNLNDVYGRIARADIVRNMPILESMLTEEAGDLITTGSDVAMLIPEDRVAYAMPMSRYSSLAWALQPGDHVDVMLSLLIVGLDEEFQTLTPNTAGCMGTLAEGEKCQDGILGRIEVLPNGAVVNVVPNEVQRPRLVTQLTVQDAVVLQVGDWVSEAAAPGETPEGDEQLEEQPVEGEAAPALPASDRVEPLTLAVTRQDAMVLDYAQAVGARVNLVLRRPGDEQTPTTKSITLQYLMDRFVIELPPKLPYGVTPPIAELERVARGEAAAQFGATPIEYSNVDE
ncbi:MAG: Flp pilus assembly protein CpaB [Chloroflexota bacterium]|nr:Flp pilus assembly protein CpaB [Chloroflexota bacterium]